MPGSPYLDSDAVFAVKPSLVASFDKTDDAELAAAHEVDVPFIHAHVDLALAPADTSTSGASDEGEEASP